MHTDNDYRAPIMDPENERWAGWRGDDTPGFYGPVEDAQRRAAFQQRVLEGLALRETGQLGQRFKRKAVLNDAKSQWRMALRVLSEEELDTMDGAGDVAHHRLIVDHANRAVVLVADQDQSALTSIEAVRAMVRDPSQPTFGYTTRAIVAVFLDTPGEDPFQAHPYELLTLTHYAPEKVVLVGHGKRASEELEQAIAQPEATFAELYAQAIAFLSAWRLDDDQAGEKMNAWLQVVMRAIAEDELRDRSPPSKPLAAAFEMIREEDLFSQTQSQLWVEAAMIHGFEPVGGSRRVSFRNSVYDPSVLDG